jgi:hypothetical protein
MKKTIISMIMAAAISLFAAESSAFDIYTELTTVAVQSIDPNDNSIGVAKGTFFDKNGDVIKTTYYTSMGGWHGYYLNDAWGRKAKSVRIEAFGCVGDGPVSFTEETLGGLLNRFFNPAGGEYTIRYVVKGNIKTHSTTNLIEEAAQLKQLLGYLNLWPYKSNEDIFFFYGALHELQRIGTKGIAAEPYLISIIQRYITRTTPDSALREAISSLGTIGARSRHAVSVLESVITNKEMSSFHRPAVLALKTMGPDTEGVMKALITSLSFDSEYTALGVFSDWEEKANAAVPAIIRILEKENNQSVISSALYTLQKIGTNEARKANNIYKKKFGFI